MLSAVEVVVAALGVGVSAGLSDVIKGEIAGAWQSLRSGVAGFLGQGRGLRVLEAFEAAPDAGRAELERRLIDDEFDDPALVEAARRILAVADPAGTAAGKYRVDAAGARSVSVGDTTFNTTGPNHGVIGGTFNEQVTFTAQVPLPPTSPAAEH